MISIAMNKNGLWILFNLRLLKPHIYKILASSYLFS